MLPEFLRKKENLIYLVLIIAGAMMLATLTAPRKAHAGTFGVDIEGSVGLAATNDQIKAIDTDASQVGAAFGIGAGLVLKSNSMMAEVFGRYSYLNAVGSIEGLTLATNNLIDTGLRLGWRATANTTIYGEAGYGWEDVSLTMPSVASFKGSPQGFMAGLGVQHELGKSNWLVGLEYQQFFFGETTLSGVPVTPDTNVVRASLTYRFGEQKQSIFTDNQPEPQSEACDPKLFNCHAPLK